MYKGVNRFMNSGPGRDTSMSPHRMKRPPKPNRQELLLAAGMRAVGEEAFMARIEGELRKLVARGIKNPRLQADMLNKMQVLTANGGKWDAARIVTFYERQKTRRMRSGPIQQHCEPPPLKLANPVLTSELVAKLKDLT